MNAPIKWAGGKRWIVPMLSEYFESYRDRRFVEPFCGGLSVTLGLNPARALAADTLQPLINFWQRLKLGLTIPAWPNTAEEYAARRARFNQIYRNTFDVVQAEEAAALFYYLNRTGFNGLCRFNASGGFNVPWGHAKGGRLLPLGDYREALTNVEFLCADFRETLAHCHAGDFIYADPPYDTEFTAYAPGGFHWAEQEKLARLLADAPCPVVLSNQATERIERLYLDLGFTISYHDVRRSIRQYKTDGGKQADRRAREIIATRNL
jgi:DNA adenine methylase